MQSLKELYRYGMGPSSSHTMGPRRAAEIFRERNSKACQIKVDLYGSLSLTGKGHLTDQAILSGLAPLSCEIIWHESSLDFHPNGMRFRSFDGNNNLLEEWTVFSIGGGELRELGQCQAETPYVYKQDSMAMVLEWTEKTGQPIWSLTMETEGPSLWEYLKFVWAKIKQSAEEGLGKEGCLPGGLHLKRKAHSFMARTKQLHKKSQRTALLSAYALAVSEQNAAGGFVVTAPTCGSCGVLPAVLLYLKKELKVSEDSIIKAMATAGIVGNLVKRNASISGAEVGCQGEVGVACAMASAAAAQLMGGTPHQVEYAAEIGLEHHLGLTCDPVLGLVQVPCIERNAFGAIRGLAAAEYSLLSDGRHLISFDQVVDVMQQTGHDLPSLYRETSQGGLARAFKPQNNARV
ncbi:L-serine ammonia-lyase [Desulfonatronovibrio magnus]|uniref:L-serine ammonia-lyase n=1 Tax=Desulfonatronovibrio magnus TaxID=698827 RepID=UPI0005EB9057|nr:L-serine ammonia-lyase [Desulfonatronovibrio magnus]